MIEVLPSKLKFDQRRYQQILLNLLSNAVKYSNQGTIVVRPSVIVEDGERIILSTKVSD